MLTAGVFCVETYLLAVRFAGAVALREANYTLCALNDAAFSIRWLKGTECIVV